MERVTQSLPIDSPPGNHSARIVGSGEMAELTRRFDWGKTPLGPIENWPDTLLTTVNLLLATSHPMFFWWGPELIQFYNDGYRPSIGMDKHPSALGQRGPECWPEIWPIIGPQIEASMTRGESSWHSNQLVPIFRDGRLEEVFWTYSYSPVRDKDGIVRGTLVVCSETTEQVLSTRRQRTLMAITSLSGRRSLPGSLAAHLIDTLAGNKDDIPFAAIFEIDATGTAGLMAHTGAESDCFSPATWPVSEVAKSKAPRLLNNVRQRIGLVCFPWPEPVESAYILPVGSAELGTAKVLLLGISSRLRFDVQYETFFQLVGNRLGTLFDLSDHEDRRKQDALNLSLQRARLGELFHQAPAFIAVLRGKDHVFEMTNPLYQDLIASRNVLGKSLLDALPELVEQGILPLLDRVYQTGLAFRAHSFKVKLAHIAGQPLEDRYLDFVYQPVREADGSISGIIVLGVDVTERWQAEQALEESRSQAQQRLSELETIYRSAPIGLALFDPVEFRYLRLNDRQVEIVGLPREQVLGKTVTEIAPIPGLHEMFEQVARGIPVKDTLLRGELPTRPGEHRYWTVNYEPIYGPDGTLQAITAASLEITAQKRVERVLIQNEKLVAVGRLASSIAHEINNPLEAVTNLLFLIGTTALPPDAKAYVEVAQSELARVSQITLQTLRFHRQSTSAREVRLSTILDDLLALFHGRLSNAALIVEKRYTQTRTILAYEKDLRQVFTNIVENEIDASSLGGRIILR
ncbi:MAG TPA: PAS domain-containing protein, partial [Terriglobales bacterium]|nr:PAS domain-containing protein [Terriglobales bacterium]